MLQLIFQVLFLIIYLSIALFAFYTILRTNNRIKKDNEQITQEQKEKYKMFTRDNYKQNKVKTFLGALFLCPFRFIAFILLLLTQYLFRRLIKMIFRLKSQEKLKFKLNTLFSKCLTKLILINFGFFNIKVKKISNAKNKIQTESPIIISNHVTLTDIFVMIHYFGSAFIAKSQVKTYPLFGLLAEEMQTLFVNRSNKDQKHEVLNQITQRVDEFNPKIHNPLTIFPEGTTTNGNQILAFKKGAFFNLQPIQIVNLNYKNENINLYLDSYGTTFCLFNIFCQFQNELEIKVFDIIQPDTIGIDIKKDENWETYSQAVQKIITEHTQLDFVEAGYQESCEFQNILFQIWQKSGYNDKKHN